MRPERLSIAGFGPFREPIELDLEDVDFFALVGPTGAGKSTVLDAISFALYGSVPRHGGGEVAPLVSVGSNEARVALDFSIGEARYLAARVLRRVASGAVQQKEARLERLDEPSVLAGGVREMQPAVVGLLGLPYEHFRKCVALPQGEFARFLHDRPADRQEVLAGLLGLDVYTRVGQRARERARVSRRDCEEAQRLLARLSDVTPERVDVARENLAALRTLHADVRSGALELTALDDQAASHEERANRLREQLAALSNLRPPLGLAALSEELMQARAATTAAETEVRTAATEMERRDRESAGLPDRAELAGAAQAHQHRAARSEELGEARRAEEACMAATRRAREALDVAAAALANADSLLETARTQHARHDLAADLRAGEPCPVCGQIVSQPPQLPSPAELEAARAARAEMGSRESRTRHEVQQAEMAEVAARTARESLAAQLAELEHLVAEHPDPQRVQQMISDAARVDALTHDAKERDRTARAALDLAQRSERALADRRREAVSELTSARDAVASLSPPVLDLDDVADAWAILTAWAAQQLPALEEQVRSSAEAAKTVRDERRRMLDTHVAAASKLGVAVELVDGEPTTLLEAVVDAGTSARHELERLERDLEQGEQLAKEVERLDGEAEVAEELGRLLSARGFEAWLVEEALARLVHGASSTLHELSRGDYSLSFDEQREFTVVDHRNADELRTARTLSGGETFQASLALALALADQLRELAAEHAAPIEAIFLDEGFGTLDAESLDTVAATIETLGARGRMVGIVTHVRELAERVPVRFEVRRVGASSIVERLDA